MPQPNLSCDKLDDIEDIFSMASTTCAVGRLRPTSRQSASIFFEPSDIARLISPSSRLNDVCMNDGILLLQSHLRTEHSDRCAVLSTWVMRYLRIGSDDGCLWRAVHHTRYWEKDIWIVPIHWQDPYEHWTFCVVDTLTYTILTFDSLANRSLWRRDVEVIT
jgi:Ulp1 family protease